MEWSRYYKIADKTLPCGFTIKRKRKVNGKWQTQSFPAEKYRDLSENEAELLLKRLNVDFEDKAKEAEERFDLHHTFVNNRSLQKFEDLLSSRANDVNHIRTMMTYLKEYTIKYFVLEMNKPDPQTWHKLEAEWGIWLVNKKKLSASTIKQVTQNANRFLRSLMKLYPEKLTITELEPVGRNKLKKIKADSVVHRHKYIDGRKFREIKRKLRAVESPVLPHIILCYCFGLRISETLGLSVEKVRKKSLLVDKQGVGFTDGVLRTDDVKTIDKRNVPYFFLKQATTIELIKHIKAHSMHPDTLGKAVNEELAKFGHQSHDLRRSWITRTFRRAKHWRDVQMASGHKDLRTTMRYAQDDRNLDDDEVWTN